MFIIRRVARTPLTGKKNPFLFMSRFFSEKGVCYNGPRDTYINSGFELQNEDTEKLISMIKESLKLKLVCCNYFSEDIGKHYLELAILEHKNLLLDDAKAHYFKSYEIYQNVKGELSYTCATIQTYIGVIYKDLGDFEKSEEFLQLSLANKKTICQEKSYLFVDTLNNLGFLYQHKKEYTKSVECFEECLRILLASEIELNKNEQIALCYYNLAFSYKSLNDLTASLTCLIRSITVAQNVFGPTHNLTRRIEDFYQRVKEEAETKQAKVACVRATEQEKEKKNDR